MQKRLLTLFSISFLLLSLCAGCTQKKEPLPAGDSRRQLLEETAMPTSTPTPTPTATPTPKTAVLNDYFGTHIDEAIEELNALDLNLQISYEYVEPVLSALARDCILGQEPAPGAKLSEGDTVEFTVSNGVRFTVIDQKGYSAEEIISYFNETVMSSEYYDGDEPECLRKWQAPISYFLEGNVTEEDLALIERLTGTLNEITGFPGIHAAAKEEDANLVIRILPTDEYTEYALERIGDENTDGYATGWYSGYVYSQGEVGICDDIDRETKNSVILEEIIQCMGIFNDSYTYPDSLFYQGFNTPQWPTDMDWLMVQLLYCPELEPGMTDEEATAVLRGLLSDVAAAPAIP